MSAEALGSFSAVPSRSAYHEKAPSARERFAKRRVWHVLAIEDDADDVYLIRSTLSEGRGPLAGGFEVVARDSIAAGIAHLQSTEVDVLLLDLTLPDSLGLAGLALVREARPELPIVVLTGQDDELLALRALREGAQDYILKSQMFTTLLTRSLRHAIERKRTERARVASEDRYRQLLETAGEGVCTFDVEGAIDYANPRMLEMLAVEATEVIASRMEKFVVPMQSTALSDMLQRCREGDRVAREFQFLRSDGSELYAKISCSPLCDPDQKVVGTLAFFTDLSERREAERVLREREEQLRESQKLEAVGRLAGGIAHDFNNMLTVISSYTEMVLATPALDPAIAGDLSEVSAAADRAANLTRQLLAFSRKQLSEYEPVDLAHVVSGIRGLLRPLTGEDVGLRFNLSASLPPILADPGQLEQVLVNLVCNARDAMPYGGAIEIAVSPLTTPNDAVAPGIPAGEYVLLEVVDTGCGMEPEVLAKVFEPFFTTKAVGRGTGLGLATVYGIVHQAGGHIWCESEVGKGSCFRLAFPVHFGVAAVHSTPPVGDGAPRPGTERILLVEDDVAVRLVIERVLIAKGYTVQSAGDGNEALAALAEVDGAVDLVITDLVMPQMSGPELVSAACLAYPHLRIVYMSGYSSQDTWKQALSERHDAFLQKPFSSEELLSTVGVALNEARLSA